MIEEERGPHGKRIIICARCQQKKEHTAKGLCNNCYKTHGWEGNQIVCKRCKRLRPHHSKGYCSSCKTVVFSYHHVKRYNAWKYHKISLELYTQLTQKCTLCSFSSVVDLHHKDGNHQNNDPSNLVGLCPNHHKMYHKEEYRQKILNQLRKRGVV